MKKNTLFRYLLVYTIDIKKEAFFISMVLYYRFIIQFNSIYFKDSLCHSNQASKVKTKNNITEHKLK